MSVIEIRNLSFTYEGSSEPVFDGVSFIIDSNWKLGFVGRNGKGKTTLLKILLGECEYSGSLISSEVFQYFPRIIPEEKWDSTADELIEEAYPGRESWRILAEIDKLGMDAELMYRPYRTLSFGERTRIQLAALFSGDNEFLLIDEPTNHLDEETKEQIKKYLNSKKGFILVSHDRDVLDACTDHTLAPFRAECFLQKLRRILLHFYILERVLELITGAPAVAVDAPMRTPTVDIHPAGTMVIRQDPFCIHKVHLLSPSLLLRTIVYHKRNVFSTTYSCFFCM